MQIESYRERDLNIFEISDNHHLRLLEVRLNVVHVHSFIIGDKSNLLSVYA